MASASFILVSNGADEDESQQPTQEDVRNLIDQNQALLDQNKALLAQMRGMRLLLRDPSSRLIQRVARGVAGRRRAAHKLAAAVKIQSAARASLMTALRRNVLDAVVALQAHVRARKATRIVQRVREVAAAVVVATAARRYLALTTTVVGKLLSKTRRQAKALAAKDRELAKAKKRIANLSKEVSTASAVARLREFVERPLPHTN